MDASDPRSRPSLRELAAASGNDPWACRACGCTDWRVVRSQLLVGVRRRERVCRHCGHMIITNEAPVPTED